MSLNGSQNASRRLGERDEWAQDVATRLGSSTHLAQTRASLGGLVTAARSRRDVLKWLGIGAGVAAAPTLLAACGGDSSPAAGASATGIPDGSGRTLSVSVWGGETERAFKETVEPVFRKLTGAKVQYDTGSGGERFNKLLAQASAPTVDVFVNSGENVFQANRQGLLADIDTRRVPNAADIADWAKLFPYGISYGLVAFGLTRAAGVPALTSWSDLWRPDLAGKLGLPGIGHTQMPMFLIMAAELNGGSESDIDPGLKALAKLDPAVLQYFWGEWADRAKAGEVSVVPEFNYSLLGANDAGVGFTFDFPEEKAIAADNTMAIVKGRPNEDLAHVFLDVAFDADVQTAFCGEWLGSPANVKATIAPKIAGRVPLAADILDQVRFFDLGKIATKRAEWTERLNSEVLPSWE
ncbi:extracellular solute-binding protein [Nocardioides sp. L-11A]|uniref:extracellular solute-binding protein n=1 Tax=Nocardioides sp. L-11A TaxID=3043848 RepID=UPI002499BCDF|nr:extracellular solute-binding protein [Nocardioides sp. L-11A]